jgi:hypothetical protein
MLAGFRAQISGLKTALDYKPIIEPRRISRLERPDINSLPQNQSPRCHLADFDDLLALRGSFPKTCSGAQGTARPERPFSDK